MIKAKSCPDEWVFINGIAAHAMNSNTVITIEDVFQLQGCRYLNMVRILVLNIFERWILISPISAKLIIISEMMIGKWRKSTVQSL